MWIVNIVDTQLNHIDSSNQLRLGLAEGLVFHNVNMCMFGITMCMPKSRGSTMIL